MKKMNMVEKFGAIKAMLNGEKVENFSIEDALTFIDGRIEQVEKKNAAGGERKPTKTQIANEGVKATIVEVLRNADKPMTITDMQKNFPELADLSNQKVSALVRQLIADGKVVKTEDKRKSYFSLA